MSLKSVTDIQKELADREAIKDCLVRYCRGVDRLDRELLEEVYWPGAMDDHVNFKGTGQEFIEYLQPVLGAMEQTMHKLGNIFIEIQDESTARSESYFDAFHRLPGESAGHCRDLIVGGRYLDRFEKRNDYWKIADRRVILDWFRLYEDSGEWSIKPLGMEVTPGCRKPADPSYTVFDY